jgi:hypothetical protein
MAATPPSPPILGLYEAGGNFPTGGPSAWPSGPTTNLAAEYFAMDSDDLFDTFGTPWVQKCVANDLTPYVEIEPWDYDQSGVPFSDITSGVWDTYFEQVGAAIAGVGTTVILTFGHEFNVSGQYPWAYQATESSLTGSGPGGADLTASEWVAGWKYAHDKVNESANGFALWMWAPGAVTGGSSTTSPVPWWPGTGYADMVGVDGYEGLDGGPVGFSNIFSSILSDIRGLGWTNPIFIAETSLTNMVEQGGDSITTFVSDMHAAGMSGILEFEDGFTAMTSAQWTTYNNAVASFTWGGGSTPPPTGGGGSLTVTLATGDEVSSASGVAHSTTSFSPTAGSMVRVAAAWLDADDLLGKTFTLADSHGSSYSLTQQGGDADGGCYLLVFDHVYASAPGATTVTITCSNTAAADCLIQPYLITGQAADQSGAAHNSVSEVGTPTNTYEVSLTTTVAGSVVWVLGAPNNGGHPVPVAISGTTTDIDWDDDNVGSHGVVGRSTSATVTPGSATFGWTSTAASEFGYGVMASEVIPAAASSGGGLLMVGIA